MEHQRRIATEQARGINALPEQALKAGGVLIIPQALHRNAPIMYLAFSNGALPSKTALPVTMMSAPRPGDVRQCCRE